MGLSSRRGKGGGFDLGNALVGFFGGDEALAMLQRRRQLALAEAEAGAERRAGRDRASVLRAFGLSKAEIAAMRPEEASRLAMERLRTRLAGPVAFGPAPGFGAAARGTPSAPPPPAGPAPGTVAGGRRFRGGDPDDRRKWEPIGAAPGGRGGFPGFPF